MSRDHTWTMGSLCVKWFWRGVFVGALGILALEAFAFIMGKVFAS